MSIPNIDSIAKFLVFLGIACIVISGFYVFQRYQRLEEKTIDFFHTQIPYIKELKSHTEKISTFSKDLSMIDSQQTLVFNKILSAPQDKSLRVRYSSLLSIRDSLSNALYENISDSSSLQELSIKYEQIDKDLEIIGKTFQEEKKPAILLIILGVLLIVLGILKWHTKERIENSILIRQNLDKPNFSHSCQSCGKTFNSLITYGTENDGTKNYTFCFECYRNGKFVEENLTLEELVKRTQEFLKTNKISEKRTKQIIKKISSLDRWKKDQYYIIDF